MEPRSAEHAAYGQALRAFRMEVGLSQGQLAQEAGLDRSYVSGIERGERNPSLANILKLTDVLGIKLSDLARAAEELLADEITPQGP
jgi:transcriptional regulator with XRE-family HTH domain